MIGRSGETAVLTREEGMLLKYFTPAPALLMLVVLAGINQPAWSQSGLVAPRPMTSPQPPQPTNAQGEPVEGWVTLRYAVLEDGTPTDIRAVDVMPPWIDSAPTIDTFGEWTFFPGTLDAEAIDWYNNETVVLFRSPNGTPEPSRSFEEGYQAVGAMIQETDFDAALAASRSLIDEQATRLGDIGVALAQSALIHFGQQDFQSALHPIQQASDRRLPLLGGDDLAATLRVRMQVEHGLGRIGEALESYNRLALALGKNPDDISPDFARIREALKDSLESAEYLPVAGRIDDRPWRIAPQRRFFYIEGIEGEVQSIDAECDTRKISLEFNPEDNYGLPESFGDCVIFVHGDPGTEFTFVQVLPPSDE
jgi:tetratricopeptide (TPR) repeat protein